MKTLILILLSFSLLVNAQRFDFTVDLTGVTDTIIQPENLTDISGHDYSISIDFTDIDTTFSFDIGGSLIESDPVTHVYIYQSLGLRYTPFVIYPHVYDNVLSFHGHHFPYLTPLIKLSNNNGATGELTFKIIFYR